MTNKTFLILLLLGVSYTAYNAAAVSENFEISTTIDHEIVLGNFKAASEDGNIIKTGDISLGTIVINKDATGITAWEYSDSGIFRLKSGNGIVSAPNITVGTFTANIANPSACTTASNSCGGLNIAGNHGSSIYNIFGGNSNSKGCNFYMKYNESADNFKVYPIVCQINDSSQVTTGTKTGTLTVSYTPS